MGHRSGVAIELGAGWSPQRRPARGVGTEQDLVTQLGDPTIEVLGPVRRGLGLAHIYGRYRRGPITQCSSEFAECDGRGACYPDPWIRREHERVDHQGHPAADQHLEEPHLGCGR